MKFCIFLYLFWFKKKTGSLLFIFYKKKSNSLYPNVHPCDIHFQQFMFVFKRHLDYRQGRTNTGCYQGISSSGWLHKFGLLRGFQVQKIAPQMLSSFVTSFCYLLKIQNLYLEHFFPSISGRIAREKSIKDRESKSLKNFKKELTQLSKWDLKKIYYHIKCKYVDNNYYRKRFVCQIFPGLLGSLFFPDWNSIPTLSLFMEPA